jgi:hypothetical protein
MINTFLIAKMTHNCLGYEYLRDLPFNFASAHQTENARGFQ